MEAKTVITVEDVVNSYPQQKNQPVLRLLNGDKHISIDGPDVLNIFMQNNVGLYTNGNDYFFVTVLSLDKVPVKKFFLEITLPFHDKKCRMKILSSMYQKEKIQENRLDQDLLRKYREVFPLYIQKPNEFPLKITSENFRIIHDDND